MRRAKVEFVAKPKERARAASFAGLLQYYSENNVNLPGIEPPGHLACLADQLVESRRRIEFVYHLRDAQHSARRKDPADEIFDPLRAAVIYARSGDLDEAYWLVFLATHFGKHEVHGWRLVREVYGKLGSGRWDWQTVRSHPDAFGDWIEANQAALSANRFSNHRKYESLRADSSKGTAAVVHSYVEWVRPHGSHSEMIRNVHRIVGQEPGGVFSQLYRSMTEVNRFGRLARFDYLTMLGKLGIAPIEPDSAYLWHNATGPLKGARLLFCGRSDAAEAARHLDEKLKGLDQCLHVGMQALEDSLCNWQKSPAMFIAFRG
jgi:hypothetical protein